MIQWNSDAWDEYLSGMMPEEKFAPIITLVVYFETEYKWDGARCPYDCQGHDTFDEYQTGRRDTICVKRLRI